MTDLSEAPVVPDPTSATDCDNDDETPDQIPRHPTHCLNCGAPIHARRSTRTYCSDRCRKSAKRAEGRLPERRILGLLAELGLIGQVWPVYRWDTSPRVLGLMVPRSFALAEIKIAAPEITDADLVSTLRRFHVHVGNVEAELIRRARRRDFEEDG